MPEGGQPAYEYLIEVGQTTLPGGWHQFLSR